MVMLEHEELVEVRKSLELRKRTSGVGTKEHEVCKRVLVKLDESERRADEALRPSRNGLHRDVH